VEIGDLGLRRSAVNALSRAGVLAFSIGELFRRVARWRSRLKPWSAVAVFGCSRAAENG
jgi:hypothetical protein